MTIVVGYVGTPEGEAALGAGLARAADAGDDLVILNSPRYGASADEYLIDQRARSNLLQRARLAGVPARIDHTNHQDAVVEAVETVIATTGARLIVIGLRRRSAVGKLILGSNAQRILLDVDIPVLVVKAPPG